MVRDRLWPYPGRRVAPGVVGEEGDLVLGLLANKENLRMHVMHAALLVGLLAFLGTARGLTKLPAAFAGTAERPGAVYAQAATAVLSLIYLAFGVRSFIAARRARSA